MKGTTANKLFWEEKGNVLGGKSKYPLLLIY